MWSILEQWAQPLKHRRNSCYWFLIIGLWLERRFWNHKIFYPKITLEVLENGLPNGVVLNVKLKKNQKLKESECRQASALGREIWQTKNTSRKRLLLACRRICKPRQGEIPMNGHKMISYRLYQCNLTWLPITRYKNLTLEMEWIKRLVFGFILSLLQPYW
jgi:hypothetical protein